MYIAGYNWVAILVAALAVQPIGAFWYSTRAFGKPWLAELGITPEQAHASEMKLLFAIGFLSPLVGAAVLAWLTAATGMTGLGPGALLGAIVGVVFTSVGNGPHYAFSGASLRLFLIDSGHTLAVSIVLGAIVGAWR